MSNDTPQYDVSELIPKHMQMNIPATAQAQYTAPAEPSPVFDVRSLGWENISTPVVNNVPRALIDSKLNWTVLPRPVIVDGCPVPGRFANVRSDLPPGHNVLEIVGSKYQIIQNHAALAFVQAIIDVGEIKLVNAGTFDEGRSVFLLASTKGLTIAGERIDPYIVFSNSHDGSGKVKAALTTIRVRCRNTLSLALDRAPRVWAVTHTKSAIDHMKAATESMNFVGNYLTEYPSQVERLMETEISDAQFAEITNRLYPVPVATPSNTTAVRNATSDREVFVRVYNDTPDLKDWAGTAWGVLGAHSDVISHRAPQRTTATFEQNRFARNAIGGRDTALAQAVIMRVVGGMASA